MTQTFKNDDSFFIVLMPTRCPIRFWDIYKWVEKDSNARFRFIRDLEIESERLTMKEVDEIYPGVKTIGIVTNPWARVAYSYAMSIDPPEGYPGIDKINELFEGIDFSSFDNYVNSIITCKSLAKKHHPTLSQSFWLTNEDKDVDFLIKAETINKDFEAIQKYFTTDRPLGIEDFNFEYQKFYSDESKDLVQKIFEKDIEKYGYSF